MKISLRSPRNKGYTLVEALMASALLGAMIGGAVALVGTMNLQERTAISGTTALNTLETAARLWQFGLTPTEVQSVMPTNTNNEFVDVNILVTASNAVTFGNATTTTLSSSMGSLENISCAVTMKDPQGTNNRTVTAQVYRPVLR
jgi:type II secretory pathway pseudopilin PulG